MTYAKALLILFLMTHAALAQNYKVDLININDEALTIGTLYLKDNGKYELSLDETLFSDEFLSMRPFLCLRGKENWYCHLAYFYDLERKITKDDLTPLEYDLLFIKKGADEFGIDAWNGRYYQLQWQGDNIIGEVYETDLNALAVPPSGNNARPISDQDLQPSHNPLYPRIVISTQ